jgi:hypothetical protein
MDWAAGAVGLGGVAVALLTLILTYKSRFSPYQQQLYERQLDAATEVLQALGRYHDIGLSIVDGSGTGPSAISDERLQLVEAKTEFFRAYRRWNVVIPQPVTEAVTAYLRTIESVVSVDPKDGPRSGSSATNAGEQLAAAYAKVLGVAQRELRVRTLSDKTLSSIESLSGSHTESLPLVDPLYIKVLAERRLFENFVGESPVSRTAPAGAAEAGTIAAVRERLYVESRNLFLVHAWRPSARIGQVVDISVRIAEHRRRGGWPRARQASLESPLAGGLVERVEYYLGESFRHPLVRRDAAVGFRLDVSAYGPTLCVARVYFNDGKPPVTLYRYMDFVLSELPQANDVEDQAD